MTARQERHRGRVHRASPLTFAWIVLLALKLVGVIRWSWWLVFVPFWGPVLIAVPFAAVVLMSLGTGRLSERLARWRIRRRHAADNPELWL
jgi:hypothetical protein